MMKFRENEEAVSPVIGVILMVAITVILAAVIAAFVFGMPGNVQTTKTVSMQAALSGNNITLTISGGPDLNTVQTLTITLDGDAPGELFAANGTTLGADKSVLEPADLGGETFKAGDNIKIEGNSGRLLVVGQWPDGAEQIILDRTF